MTTISLYLTEDDYSKMLACIGAVAYKVPEGERQEYFDLINRITAIAESE